MDRRTCTITARTICDVVVLTKAELEAVVTEFPNLLTHMLDVANRRLAELGEVARIPNFHKAVTASVTTATTGAKWLKKSSVGVGRKASLTAFGETRKVAPAAPDGGGVGLSASERSSNGTEGGGSSATWAVPAGASVEAVGGAANEQLEALTGLVHALSSEVAAMRRDLSGVLEARVAPASALEGSVQTASQPA